MTSRDKTIVVVCVGLALLLLLGMSLIVFFGVVSDRPANRLTYSEAKQQCEALLRSIAWKRGTDYRDFRLAAYRQYWQEPELTQEWDFFYKCPENPKVYYWLCWLQSTGHTDWVTMDDLPDNARLVKQGDPIPVTHQPGERMSREQARKECEALLPTVALKRKINRAKFRLVAYQKYWQRNDHTQGWDFYYYNPESPGMYYEFLWLQGLGCPGWFTTNRLPTGLQMVAPQRGRAPQSSTVGTVVIRSKCAV